ncbi:MAG: PspA/IM30 family protein [Candidatus Poribacteria bacterium]|nr:PspA/IM30 family protein [Candidatus Poribacteria bacterium]
MGFFNRISTIFKANVNDALDKAEDPEKMLNQITTEMQEQLVTVKQQVAASIANEKRLQRDYEKEQEQADGWEQKATIALQRDNEDLARQALARRNEHRDIANGYKEQWEKQRQAVETLKENLRILERKIEEARRKKDLLIARQKRAKAQKMIHETMAGMKDNSAFASFERMEAKVGDMEARADAAAEMAEMSRDPLEDEFAALETGSVDDDLAALKAKVSGSGNA